jgi:hypothetical protein
MWPLDGSGSLRPGGEKAYRFIDRDGGMLDIYSFAIGEHLLQYGVWRKG